MSAQKTVDKQNLNPKEQSLVKISSSTAIGNLENLKLDLNKGLDEGLSINEIKEALTQLYAYCGFPRSLNAINTFKTVLDERKSKGIKDNDGKKIVVENKVADKYEQGRKTLETLTKMPQSKPAPGLGEFAPRIDAFLKEHLFADIFVSDVLTFQQRELVTISALASISGVESQLQSHINIGKNTGITDDQLVELADLIQESVSKTQANTVRKIIGKPLVPIIENDMMVRISEIEIVPEFLEEYKSILKEEASASVKLEKGVISIFPMYEQKNPTQIRIIEIYANKDSYQFHLQTPHFQHYKTSTLKMVKSLNLIDMESLDKETMSLIFDKIKYLKMSTKVKAYGTSSAEKPLEEITIERRTVQAHDVEFEILYCGICHSDLHQVKGDFGPFAVPIVPGHELLGKVTSIGEHVKYYKIGDLVGVGCIVDSCGKCEYCEDGIEQFCDEGVTFSFNSEDKISGGHTFGGFSKTYVCNEKYVLRMPAFDNLPASAPLLCAGITVYSPLKHWGASPGKKVGVLGIGGLGHLAIKIAKAMGAEVVVFTTSPNKVEDAKRLGADEAVLSTDAEAMAKYNRQLHFIIDTVSAKHDVNVYLNLLRHDGTVVLVGLPPEPLEIGAFNVVNGRRSFAGSNIGGIAETQEMLDFCFEHNITAESEIINIQDVNTAFERLEKGNVKYRFVIDMASLQN